MAISKVQLPDGTTQDVHDSRVAGVDSSPVSGSGNLVTSGGVYTALSEYPKYYLCTDETEYEAITNPNPGTLYLIPKT